MQRQIIAAALSKSGNGMAGDTIRRSKPKAPSMPSMPFLRLWPPTGCRMFRGCTPSDHPEWETKGFKRAYVIGVGMGGSFAQAALLAQKALLWPIGKPNPDKSLADQIFCNRFVAGFKA
jgi:hypothetical protein